MHTTSYAIKRPDSAPGPGKRRTFAIQAVTGSKRKTLKLEPLAAINRSLLAGLVSLNEAARQVEALRDALYDERPDPQAVFSSENLTLLEKYWKSEYATRDLVDAKTMKADLRRAVAACGTISLLAGSRQDLQEAINAKFEDLPSKQRRAVSRLNQILRFAGRDFKLRMVRALRLEPQYLTWSELEQVLPHLPSHEWRLLARVAWVTGCRLGEIFGLTRRSIRTGHVQVTGQLDEKGKRRETKTRSERKAPILRDAQGEIWVSGWVDLGPQIHAELRTIRHSTIFKRACRRAFKSAPDKHCRFHDIRHSYAVEMLNRGVPIGLVAKSLGNSVAVCERYYSGFVLQDESVDTVLRLLKAPSGA